MPSADRPPPYPVRVRSARTLARYALTLGALAIACSLTALIIVITSS